jgi:hypothetical protein
VEYSKKWLCSRENKLEVSASNSRAIALCSHSIDDPAAGGGLSFVLINLLVTDFFFLQILAHPVFKM